MTTTSKLTSGLLWMTILFTGGLYAAERPTLVHTADPRPDILPRPIYEAYTEYRRRYNRPRNFGGWVARWISPTSQEGMVWYENKLAGSYDRPHMPPRYKQYFVPKPWEALQTSARPDFPQAEPEVTEPFRVPEQSSEPERLDALGTEPVAPQELRPQ